MELSIKKKAKRYDEIIKRAKEKYAMFEGMKQGDVLEDIFPELKESEDERIRKSLINYVYCHGDAGDFTKKEFIAWLEKQGKQKPAAKYKVGDTIYYDSFGRLVSFVIANIVEDGTDNPMYEDKDGNSVFQNDIVEQKQGEQNPADKVKPKFKVGDWVVYGNEDVDLITGLCDKGYEVNACAYIPFGCEGDIRYWTIQDAKEGDILSYDKSKCIAMFLKIEGVSFKDICFIGAIDSKFHIGSWHDIENAHPATQEQRDLLFQKMKEAGYVWDAEKKELKKIEQKPTDNIIGEEKPLLEKFKQAVYNCAWGKVTCKVEGESKEEYANRWAEQFLLIVRDWADDYIDFTVQQKLRKSYNKWKEDVIKENSPAWSEEDKTMLCYMEGHLEYLKNDKGYSSSEDQIMLKRQLEWLKSLKDRVLLQPKQE